MKDILLKIVRAFVALLHTDSDNVTQLAALKKQIADLQAQLTLSDDETTEVNAAVNMIAAASPPAATDVTPVAAVAPAPSPQPAVVEAATAAIPADVVTAASAPPSA